MPASKPIPADENLPEVGFDPVEYPWPRIDSAFWPCVSTDQVGERLIEVGLTDDVICTIEGEYYYTDEPEDMPRWYAVVDALAADDWRVIWPMEMFVDMLDCLRTGHIR